MFLEKEERFPYNDERQHIKYLKERSKLEIFPSVNKYNYKDFHCQPSEVESYTFSERVYTLAKNKNVPMVQVERNIGIAEGGHFKWEKSKPKFETLIKLADYFDVSVDYLLGRKSASGADAFLSPDERRLLDLYRSMSDQGKAHLLSTAEADAAFYIKKTVPVPGAAR